MNNLDKVSELIEKSSSYVYSYRLEEWIRFIICSILNRDFEAETVIHSIELIEKDVLSSIVLDEIYSTRLSLSTCQDILRKILIFYKNGPSFWRDIYKDYMTEGLNQLIESVESENKLFLSDKKKSL